MPLSSVVRLSEFYLTHAHTLKHRFFKIQYVGHGTLHSKEMRKKKDSVYCLYLLFIYFIYLFQAREVSIVCNVHFDQKYYLYAFLFFFVLCAI